jgi:hypothetical protein
MSTTFVAYLVYLTVSIGLTVWVARTLHRNGAVFLVDVFRGNLPVATSVNHLLVVGFYLVNLGFVCFNLKTAADLRTDKEALEMLAGKIGLGLLVIGGMHFLNVWLFHGMRRRALLEDAAPPVEPDEVLTAAAPSAGSAP